MKPSTGFPLALIAVAAITLSCATAVDMESVNRRIDGNTVRIERLETDAGRETDDGETAERIGRLEEGLKSLRKDFADSRFTTDTLLEKFESLDSYIEEMERYMAQFRKKGGELDSALEDMANKLEAQVRQLGEKLKKMMEEE